MEALQARLETFSKAKRVKQGTGKRTVSVKWPHPDTFIATPSALAEAGFYFSPSWADQDNVSCFMCGKELAGWEEDDDPFQIHWEKCRDTCAWAFIRCGLTGDVDRKGNFVFKDGSRIPNGKQMENARLTTFKTRSWWPHDAIKGHGASSTKMAKAGFVYTPSSAGDDNATCLYCNISLGGWDEDDDPLDEHRKRQDKLNMSCPFFSGPTGFAKSTSSKPPSRSSTRPRSRTGSRQLQFTLSDVSPPNSDDESELAPEPAPAASKRGRKPSSASMKGKDTLRRSTRTRATSEVNGEASGSDFGRSALRSSTRGKAKAKDKAKEPIAAIQEEGEESDEPRAKVKAKKNVKGKENEDGDGDVEEVKEKSDKAKKAREKKEGVSDEEAAPKPKRGRPKKVIEVESPDEEEEAVKPVRKGKKKVAENPPGEETKQRQAKAKPGSKVKSKATSPEVEESGPFVQANGRIEDLPIAKPRIRKPSTAKPSLASKRQPKPVVVEDESSDAFSDPSNHASHPKPAKLASRLPRTASAVSSSDDEMYSASEEPAVEEPPRIKPSSKKTKVKDPSPPSSPSPAPPSRQAARSRTTTSSSADSKASKKPQLEPAPLPPTSLSSLRNGNRGRVASGSSVSSTVSKKGKGKLALAPAKIRDLDDQMDVDEAYPRVAGETPAFHNPTTSHNGSRFDDGRMNVMEQEVSRPSSPVRPHRSPLRPTPGVRRPPDMAPSTTPRSEATPPPASSSLPSLPSFDSNTTLAPTDEVAPKRLSLTPDAALTEEERSMTVEQWIRHEIEVQYERLQRDGEMKIRMFRERAEEVRRQIEAI